MNDRLRALEIFVGTWDVQVQLPDAPTGTAVFAWELGEQYLLERSTSPQPEFPDSLAVVARDDDTDGDVDSYVQHYFDSRGVVRIYRMQLQDREWTLLRTEADFSALNFSQRFRGTFAADDNTIDGRWETSDDGGEHWELDFAITYVRRTQ